MKKKYKITNFFVLFVCLIFNFLHPCKISKQLEFQLFSQDESVISSAISSNGENLVISIKTFAGNCIMDWNLTWDSVAMQR